MEDEQGFFARLFCADAFVEQGLCADYPQWSTSFNSRCGTLRGLHFQAAPYEEIKLVSCTRGAIFDVAVDVRPGSRSRGKWVGIELSAENGSGDGRVCVVVFSDHVERGMARTRIMASPAPH